MEIIDLFSGVGGISKGFEDAGFQTVMSVEYDKSIAKAFQRNHTNTEVINEDVRNLDIKSTFSKYKNITGVVGGPPCQGFSQKGQRKTLEDQRNYLFRYYLDVIEAVSPSFFMIENVPNIINANDGSIKKEIENKVESLGYKVSCEVVNAYHFGVPQKRKRAIFIGYKGQKRLKIPTDNGKRVSVKDAIYDLPAIKSGEGVAFCSYEKAISSAYQKKMRKGSNGIHNHIATKHSATALKRLKLIPKGGGRNDLPKEHLTKSVFSGTWTRLVEDEPSNTITTRFDTPSSGLFTHPYLNRCITVREAARLQSFPDSFIFYGTKGSQMKQVGNAVPPLLANEMAKFIKQNVL